MSELSRLRLVRARFAGPQPSGVIVAIGDDAAVLTGSALSEVWTIDSAVEGRHFRREWMSLGDVGFRASMAAASDLAAMGATPRALLASLILPSSFADHELDELLQGQQEAAVALGTAVIGGNLSAGRELSITTTALGQARRPLLRSGAQSGDVLAVAGPLGLARAGLEALQKGLTGPAVETAIAAFRRPEARIAHGVSAADSGARAAIDVSDGLVLDASRIAEESGVAVVIDAAQVLASCGSALRPAAAQLGIEPLDLALFGGEDYALLVAFAGAVPTGFFPIGTFEPGSGVRLQHEDGTRAELGARGFDHFGGDDTAAR